MGWRRWLYVCVCVYIDGGKDAIVNKNWISLSFLFFFLRLSWWELTWECALHSNDWSSNRTKDMWMIEFSSIWLIISILIWHVKDLHDFFFFLVSEIIVMSTRWIIITIIIPIHIFVVIVIQRRLITNKQQLRPDNPLIHHVRYSSIRLVD